MFKGFLPFYFIPLFSVTAPSLVPHRGNSYKVSSDLRCLPSPIRCSGRGRQCFIKDSMFFEGFKGIIVKYIRPKVTVVSGSVSANDMIEVSDAVTGAISGIRPSLSMASFRKQAYPDSLHLLSCEGSCRGWRQPVTRWS